MRRLSCLLPLLWAACIAHGPAPLTPSSAPSPERLDAATASPIASAPPVPSDSGPDACPAEPPSGEAASVQPATAEGAPPSAKHALRAVAGAAPGDDDDLDDGTEAPVEEEAEAVDEAPEGEPGLRYSADLDDGALKEAWVSKPELLGSVSIGFAHQGRLFNGVRFPKGEGYKVISPDKTYATQETVDYLLAAIAKVREQYPDAPRLRVNQMSSEEGGWLRPHKSHQNGRDVDLGFYYPTEDPIRVREREKVIDVKLTWALLEALITETDVQSVLVDKRVIRVLYDHALALGRDKAWLDSIFHAGASSVVKHAPRHRDHLHVRFYNPRAQELGRRVAPLLALRPEQNILVHRVRNGDTLGHLALRYGTSINAIMKANRMKNSFLRLGQRLQVTLRGPCTRCPIPPAVVVPPRRLPPAPAIAEQAREHHGTRVAKADAKLPSAKPRTGGGASSGGSSPSHAAPHME